MKKKLIKLYLMSFFSSIMPPVIFVILHWDKYVNSVPAGAIRLSIAGVIISIVLLFKITGHLHISSRFVWYLGLAAVFWLMKTVLNDLPTFFICAAVGEGVDEIFFQTAIKKAQKERDMNQQAQIIIDQLGKVGKT